MFAIMTSDFERTSQPGIRRLQEPLHQVQCVVVRHASRAVLEVAGVVGKEGEPLQHLLFVEVGVVGQPQSLVRVVACDVAGPDVTAVTVPRRLVSPLVVHQVAELLDTR